MQHQGLSEKEAQKRLAQEGFNEMPAQQKRSFLTIAWEILREPMFLLLVACGAVYLLLGDFHEAVILLGFVFLIMGLTIFQENKTEKTLEALRDLSSPRALVIRDGFQKRIAGREVVREDLIILEEGDRVPADALVLEANDLLVDESLLTGESVPVRKKIWQNEDFLVEPGGDDLPFVYSGTMVVRGQGIARVYAIGVNSQLGRIGQSLQKIRPEETPLQKQTGKLVKNISIASLSISLLVAFLYIWRYGRWLKGILAGLTLAMSILPEEIPVVLTIFLALGAFRISQKKVLTRRIPAIETLGAATVLAVDKTGTLTLNQMSVQNLYAQGDFFEISKLAEPAVAPKFSELIRYSVLASEMIPLDPMEKAFHGLGQKFFGADFPQNFYQKHTLIKEYALSGKLPATTHIWQEKNSHKFFIAAKGGPEAIFDLGHLGEDEKKIFEEKINVMAGQGLRILAVAKGFFEGEKLPQIQHEIHFEFLGLIGLADPARPKIKEAIQECHEAGIRVVMITGDYPVTAQSIANQIGLKNSENFLVGPELKKLSDEEFQTRVSQTNIFARMIPEQKLRLVSALKTEGEIVAMTGDGVNDAPALKAAHIGIAMGEHGTDVAREASSLVLLDDSFSSIVAAVREGRRVFDNIKKAIAYTFAVHVPIAGLAFFPLLFKWPMILGPEHIVFLELIIDPACSFVFEIEPAEDNLMKRPPRRRDEPLFSKRNILLSLSQGAAVLLTLLLLYGLALKLGKNEAVSRGLVFSGLILTNLGLIINNRSLNRGFLKSLRIINAPFWLLALAALGFLGLVLYTPLKIIFKVAALGPAEIAAVFLTVAFGLLLAEGVKFLERYF